MKINVTARDIRRSNENKSRFTMEWLISRHFSPYFSVLFIKRGIRPNTITVFMILSGLIGAILFAIPDIICKVLGTVFIQLWFVFDLSDGEVARYTKQYSKYGTEMDYMAHVINHPFFIIAFALSFIQLYDVELYKLCILFMVFLVTEFWARSTVSFYNKMAQEEKMNENPNAHKNRGKLRKIFSYIIGNLWAFPNYVLIFPFLYGVDVLCHTTYFLYLTALYACFCILDNSRQIIRCLIRLYKI